jgi:hypothetical protein
MDSIKPWVESRDYEVAIGQIKDALLVSSKEKRPLARQLNTAANDGPDDFLIIAEDVLAKMGDKVRAPAGT